MKRLEIEKLNQLYRDAENIDKEIFAEYRSNLLLVAGEHYTKNSNKYFARLRETNRLSETQKLRLTKNHVHKIVRHYENAILSKAPGITVLPANPMEMQDKKEAELNKSVWEYGKKHYRLQEKIRRWAGDFTGVGEVATKIFWDPTAGEFLGYRPKMMMTPDGTEVEEMNEDGSMVPDDSMPVFSGDFVFESIPAFNLIRDPSCKEMDDARWLGLRKMVPADDLKKMYAEEPEKLKYITGSRDKTYIVFDSNQANYQKAEKEVLVKEIYFKPCMEYPEGYFYIFTDEGILEEGPLPFGIFPICWSAFDLYSTSPRGRSIVKVARPYQAEINRASSQLASHQITVGDDKILYQSGTRLARGALLPGVRGISYQGATPTILPGRDGSQFFGYIQNQISEMYQACMLEEINSQEQHNLDPYTLLFRSMSQQTKFRKYTERFERFLIDVAEKYLEMAKFYLPDDRVIAAVGKNEIVNLAEFRETTPLKFEISVEGKTDSADTVLGKQLTFNHLLQYVGKDLDKEDIGRLIKNMPFVNNEDSFSHLTVDHDNVENDMLALERGEQPFVSKNANNELYVKMFEHRMKQPDFRYLDPMIQQMYSQFLTMHQQEIARKQEEIMRAKNEFIPIGGAMIATDMYIENKEDPSKAPKRARIPYQALDWLVKQLDVQGANQVQLEQMSQSNLAEIANQINPVPQGMGGLGGLPPMPMPGQIS